jgi:hypothetical protein
MKRWTKLEIEKLKTIKSPNDLDRLSIELDRSRDAVRMKANQIGVYMQIKLEIWHDKIPLEIKSYLSGHFDGEGCIRFGVKSKERSMHRLSVSVSSANKKSLEMYCKYFNGKVVPKKHFTNKPMFLWTIVNTEDMYNFILSVNPFSIEKKEQLELGLEYIEKRKYLGKTRTLSSDFIEYVNRLSLKMKELKRL